MYTWIPRDGAIGLTLKNVDQPCRMSFKITHSFWGNQRIEICIINFEYKNNTRLLFGLEID